jgi:hypothetical protein
MLKLAAMNETLSRLKSIIREKEVTETLPYFSSNSILF